jgi:hypothetical protein
MMASGSESTTQESRAVRRLARLFKIERGGGFARRPAETVWRLIARRSTLMTELSRLERQRRAVAGPSSPELKAALAELAREVDRSRQYGQMLVEELGADIRARRGTGTATGLRDHGAGSRLLGRG